MIFYGYSRSSSAYRCRIAFNIKNVAPEFVAVHLRRDGGEQKAPAYRDLNPQRLVPVLAADGNLFAQSLAIIEWLDEKIPEPRLLPNDPALRAKVRAFAFAIACEIHPLQNLRVLDYLRNELGHPQSVLDGWCRHWIADGLAACEALLIREAARGDFCFGAMPGPADLCVVPQMFSAARFGVDITPFPRLCAVNEACTPLPAFADAHPSVQPDAEL